VLNISFTPAALDDVEISSDEMISDIHADADYRAALVKEMAKRAVIACGE